MSIEDLLIEFDEISFIPETTVPNPDEYARDYKRRLMQAIKSEIEEKLKQLAERVKMEFFYEFEEIIPSIMADKIDKLVEEFLPKEW